MKRFALLHLILLLSLLTPTPVQAQDANTFTVNRTEDAVDATPGDGRCDADPNDRVLQCTLRAAIMEANALAGAQTIRLPTGVYRLTLGGRNENNSRTGDLNITSDLAILGDAGNARPTIDASGLGDRVLHIAGVTPFQVFLQNLVIRGGDARLDEANESGGGVAIGNSAQVTIQQSLVSDNAGKFGGGISVFADGALTLIASQVRNNDDGGIHIQTSANTLIRTSTISDNRAIIGGGITVRRGLAPAIVAVAQSTIAGNTATSEGGGLWIAEGARVLLEATTVSGNNAVKGGGVSTNSVLFLQGATITRNSNEGVRADIGEIRAANSIIADNSGFDCVFIKLAASVDAPQQPLDNNSCQLLGGAGNLVNINPLLGPLQFNGGKTQTHAPLAGSPAIDGGVNTIECSLVDQRGVTRPQGARCDSGAVESTNPGLVGASVVTPTAVTAVVGESTRLTLTWTHPVRWRDLDTVDLQWRGVDAAGQATLPLWVRLTEGVMASDGVTVTNTVTNGVTLFDSAGAVAGVGATGANGVLESDTATLDLAHSRVIGTGPEGQSVTLILALRLKETVASGVYTTTVLASDDNGELQGPDAIGTLTISANAAGETVAGQLFLPLVVR